MVKKTLLMLVLVLVAAGGVFAQTDFRSMPKNTVTVDVGPTITGAAFGMVENLVGDDVLEEGQDFNTSGFGIAAQFERQVFSQLSVAARVAYLGVGFKYTGSFLDGDTVATPYQLDLTSFSAEAHARFYPFAGRTFFLGGMAGYGNLTVDASGEGESISLLPRSYLKLGARVGWRMDFGRPGGFVFEPALGYNYAIGLGDTFGKRLLNEVGSDVSINEMDDFDLAFKTLEDYIFIGGPRIILGFGWRF